MTPECDTNFDVIRCTLLQQEDPLSLGPGQTVCHCEGPTAHKVRHCMRKDADEIDQSEAPGLAPHSALDSASMPHALASPSLILLLPNATVMTLLR